MKVTASEWVSLEPCLPVREAFIVASLNELSSCAKATAPSLARVLGVDRTTVTACLRRAAAVRGNPHPVQLRPRGLMVGDRLAAAAKAKVPFIRRLSDHGLCRDDLALLGPDDGVMCRYGDARARGSSIRTASAEAGWSCNQYLDSVLLAKLRARKYPRLFSDRKWSPRASIAGVWTTGTKRGYSRLRRGYGGHIVNKASEQVEALWTESAVGVASPLAIAHDMAVLSCVVARRFWGVILARSIPELSSIGCEEYDRFVRTVRLADWRFIGSDVRCYWDVAGDCGVVMGPRTTVTSSGRVASSIDIPIASLSRR